jgi:hypothetical protein
MTTGHNMLARTRGLNQGNYPENRDDERIEALAGGEFIASQCLPRLATIVAQGNSWVVGSGAQTGLAVVPTTAGLLTLWNGESGNGRSLVIDSMLVYRRILDVTEVSIGTVWAQVIRPPMATPTDAALTIRSLSGGYGYGGRARTVATSTTLASRWDVIGQVDPVPTVAGSVFQTNDFNLLGRYIIPPGGAFTMSVSEVTATASAWNTTIRWHEVQLPLVS